MFRSMFALAVCAIVLVVLAIPAVGQDNRNYPVFVNIGGLGIQSSGFVAGSNPTPQATGPNVNNAKYYLFLRLTRNTSANPLVTEVVARKNYSLGQLNPDATPVSIVCDSTSPMLLICSFGPSGQLWTPGGPIVISVSMEDQSGHKTHMLTSVRIP